VRRRLDRKPPRPVEPRSRRRGLTDAGTATAELVVVLPAIVLALVFGLFAVVVMTTRMRCADAAEAAARLAARGEEQAVVVAAARSAAPHDSRVQVQQGRTTVTVSVASDVRFPGLGALLPAIGVSGRFEEAREPGSPP
jgi:hypothetical protein